MATDLNQQIQQQRQKIESAKRQAEAQLKAQQLSRSQLLKQTLQQQAKRKEQQKQAKARLQQVKQVETSFEKEVDKTSAQYSKDLEKQKQYEAQMKAYNAAVKERQLWEQAFSLVARGKGAAAMGDPELRGKVKKIYAGQVASLKDTGHYLQKAGVNLSEAALGYNTNSNLQGLDITKLPESIKKQVVTPEIQSPQVSLSLQPNIPDVLKPQQLSWEKQLTPQLKYSSAFPKGNYNLGNIPEEFKPQQFSWEKQTPQLNYKMSVSPEAIFSQKYETRAQKQFSDRVNKAYNYETKRYRDLGYTLNEARRLAGASISRGGFTYSPKEAKKIIRVTPSEKVSGAAYEDLPENIRGISGKKLKGKLVKVFDSPTAKAIMDRPFGYVIPTFSRESGSLTTGEAISSLKKGVTWTAKKSGEGWKDIYGKTVYKLPEELRPSKYVGPEGERPRTPREMEEAIASGWIEEAKEKGYYESVTPEQFGKGVETGVEFGAYLVPGVATPLMVSGAAEGIQRVQNPEKEAEKLFKEAEKQYKADYKNQLKNLPEGEVLEDELTTEELKAELMPRLIEQVKSQGAVEAGMNIAFLGTMGAIKGVKGVKKYTVKRPEFLGKTEAQQIKFLKDVESSKKILSESEKQISKIAKERFKYTRGEVGFDPLTGKPLPQTVKTDLKSITEGLELSAKEKKVLTTLVDKMQISKLTKSEAKLLKDVSKGRIDITTKLPEKIILMEGSLGDIKKVVKLPPLKSSPWIGKGEAKIEFMGKGIKGKDVGKQFQYVYQKGLRGKPLKETTEFQIGTSAGKKGKFTKIDVLKEARIRTRKVKTPAGDIYVTYDAPLKQPGSSIANIKKPRTIKLSEDVSVRISEVEYKELTPFKRAKKMDFLKVNPEEEAQRLMNKKYSEKELKNLFKEGTTVDKQKVIEVIKKGKVIDDVPEFVLNLQKENPQMALRLRELTKQQYAIVSSGTSSGVAPFQFKIPEAPKAQYFKPKAKTFDINIDLNKGVIEKKFIEKGGQVLEIKPESTTKEIFGPKTTIQLPSKVKFYPEKVKVVPSKLKQIPSTRYTTAGLPRMVGGTGLEIIPYAGEGTYEVSDAQVMMAPEKISPVIKPVLDSQIGTQRDLIIPRSDVFQFTKQPQLLKQPQMLKEPSVLKERTMLKQIPLMKQPQLLKERLKLRERQEPVLRQSQLLKQAQISKQVITPKITPRQGVPQSPRITPRINVPRIIIPRSTIPKVRGPRLRQEVPKEGYSFEVRRKGKWERAKTPFAFATPEGAEAMAQEKVLKEAAASYKVVKAQKGKRIVRTRKKINPYQNVLFREGKGKGVMVQKKKLRILSPGEKKEISYAGGIAKMKKSKPFMGLKNIAKKAYKKKPKVKKKKKGGKK